MVQFWNYLLKRTKKGYNLSMDIEYKEFLLQEVMENLNQTIREKTLQKFVDEAYHEIKEKMLEKPNIEKLISEIRFLVAKKLINE